MGLSYRAILGCQDPSALTAVADFLQRTPDGALIIELDGPARSMHRRQDEGKSEVSATLLDGDSPLLVVERHEPEAIDEQPLDGVPGFATALLNEATLQIGPFDPLAPVPSETFAEWVEGTEAEAAVVVGVIASGSAGAAGLLDVLATQVRGMAALAVVTPEHADRIALALGGATRLHPGSLLAVARTGSRISFEVVPPTIVSRQRENSVRRIRAWCLRALRDWPLKDAEADALRRARFEGGGLSERDVESLLGGYADLEARLADAQEQREYALLDLEDAFEQIDDLSKRVRYFGARLRELGEYAFVAADQTGEQEEIDEAEPTSCFESVAIARELLSRVDITADPATVLQLDNYEESSTWARKLWVGLRALHYYATARAEGDHSSGLYDFCANPPAGYLAMSANQVALKESESTGNDQRLRQMRTFRVPEIVDSSGYVYMEAHLKISRAGCAPRVHFHDHAAHTGRMYVGYIGPHLDTAG